MPQVQLPVAPSKPLIQSKTFWFNVGMFVAEVLVLLQAAPFVPATYVVYIGFFHSVVNIAIRIFTGKEISGILK